LANTHLIEIFIKTLLVPHSKSWKLAQPDNIRDDTYIYIIRWVYKFSKRVLSYLPVFLAFAFVHGRKGLSY